MSKKLTRREFLTAGVLGLAGTLGVAAGSKLAAGSPPLTGAHQHGGGGPHGMTMPVGEVDHARNGFNPSEILTNFDRGAVSRLPSGQTLREYWIVAHNKTVEVLPGIDFPAWTYASTGPDWQNPVGGLPGPPLRPTPR